MILAVALLTAQEVITLDALRGRPQSTPPLCVAGGSNWLYYDATNGWSKCDGTTGSISVLGESSGLWKNPFVIDTTDLTAAALCENVTLFTHTQFEDLDGLRIKHGTAFSGGSATEVTATVGCTTDTDRFALAYDLTAAVSATGWESYSLSGACEMDSDGAAIIVRVCADVNVDLLTAGELTIWIKTSTLQ